MTKQGLSGNSFTWNIKDNQYTFNRKVTVSGLLTAVSGVFSSVLKYEGDTPVVGKALVCTNSDGTVSWSDGELWTFDSSRAWDEIYWPITPDATNGKRVVIS